MRQAGVDTDMSQNVTSRQETRYIMLGEYVEILLLLPNITE